MRIKVACSILSADFSCLDREIKKVEFAGADMLHIDVMDGHFVPNLTIGPVVIKDIRRITRLPLDVHLMIENPQKYVYDFVKAGSNMITMHIETIETSQFKFHAFRLKSMKIKVGISLNPRTPLRNIKNLIGIVDLVLIMSVNPGFSGQIFNSGVLPKIKELRTIFAGDITVDGGINDRTAKKVVQAGANVLAAGSYIFNAKSYRDAIHRLKNA